MKANMKFITQLKKRDDAVSPVIAVILMVAITVVLAATVYVWVSGFGGSQSQVANTQLNAVSGNNGDIIIKHASGDLLQANKWKISIQAANADPVYCIVNTELSVGGQKTFTNLSLADANSLCTTTGAADLASGTAYQVKILETSTNTVLFDRIITP